MNIVSILLFGALTMSADAVGVRGLIAKMKEANKVNSAAAIDVDAAASAVDEEQRKLVNNGCPGGGNPTQAWHPTYSAGWTNGYCQLTVDCNSPSYSSELTCCKGAYAGQTTGYPTHPPPLPLARVDLPCTIQIIPRRGQRVIVSTIGICQVDDRPIQPCWLVVRVLMVDK